MRILIVKTSSLGDLIHTFPAITDAAAMLPDAHFDWLVEEGFREVPAWHPAVERVIPIATRRWRKDWLKAWRAGALKDFARQLRQRSYDRVIDAQGLIKSALPARLAKGPVVGFDRHSAREGVASVFYQRTVPVARDQHAIERTRRLFAAALDYSLPDGWPSYGLTTSAAMPTPRPSIICLHGTTWPSKHWPEPYWIELARLADREGFDVNLPWGDPDDRLRAERIISAAGVGTLMPQLSLTQLAERLAGAAGVVGVDSGLAHLAAAVEVPTVVVYGATDAGLTGVLGSKAIARASQFRCSPCLERSCRFGGQHDIEPVCLAELTPQRVWALLVDLMRRESTGEVSGRDAQP